MDRAKQGRRRPLAADDRGRSLADRGLEIADPTESMPVPERAKHSRTPRRRGRGGESWDERFAWLFEDLRKPARVMIARAFGSALSPEEIEDIYASAWTSTLSALRGREREMPDDELRAYLLTAVANHASKEMRRRSRRPTSALEAEHAQVLSDSHQPLPDERAVGSESNSIARDVLSSLPPRRRAVMLLRYGWGLKPAEICSLVANLSPRAYRKEVTRGVEQMIDGLRKVESGEWCESREPVLRDYVAGTASEHGRRQAVEHMAHCRQCSEFVARLSGHLHDFGSGAAWTALAGSLEHQHPDALERLADLVARGRDAFHTTTGRVSAETAEGPVALGSSAGARGAGAAGAGLAAKLSGVGFAGKAAVACLGAGAAATVCLTTGVIQIGGDERAASGREAGPATEAAAVPAPGGAPPASMDVVAMNARTASREVAHDDGGRPGHPDETSESVETDPAGAPASSPAPSAPPVESEFGLVGTASAPTATDSGSTTAGSSGSGTSAGSGASGADVAQEFGP